MINTCCDRNGLLNKYFWFYESKSVLTQLFQAKAIDCKELVEVICIDVKNAFDKLSHVYSVEISKSFGVSENILVWVIDFLYQRTQQVWLDGMLS